MNYSSIREIDLGGLNTDTIDIQQNIVKQAFENRYAIAIWQLPFDDVQHCIVDFSGNPSKTHIDIEEAAPGFAVSPFINPNLQESFFIKADFQISFGEDRWAAKEFNPLKNNSLENILTKKRNNKNKKEFDFRGFLRNGPESTFSDSYDHYQQLVSQGVEHIKAGQFLKVVLSRTKNLAYEKNFDLIALFQQLSKSYPSAFRYFFYIPDVGAWMGATPETLISVDSNQIFRTMALAGTQAFQPGVKLSDVAWRQKEIEEQAIVGRYIINCFKKIRLREFDEQGPKTVVAGNLMHLCTRYTVDMQACNFPQLGTVMLDLLHPTSAVCGMPKKPTLEFILNYENYNREFYSGFLGPVNINQESHMFVNLRCMQFLNDQMVLYAGAGITEDSEPQREWKETEIKCETLSAMIKSL